MPSLKVVINFPCNKCIYTKLQGSKFQSAFIKKKPSDINEINIRNLYKKKTKIRILAFMPPQGIDKL